MFKKIKYSFILSTILAISISSSAFAASGYKEGFIGNYKIEAHNVISTANNNISAHGFTTSYTTQWSGTQWIWTTTNIDQISASTFIYRDSIVQDYKDTGIKYNTWAADVFCK